MTDWFAEAVNICLSPYQEIASAGQPDTPSSNAGDSGVSARTDAPDRFINCLTYGPRTFFDRVNQVIDELENPAENLGGYPDPAENLRFA